MTSIRQNLTKAFINNVQLPDSGKRDYLYDTKESGLVLQVTSKGTKTFYLYKKINGKPERVRLGKYPDISVENARKLAQQNKGKIAEGKNPQNEKRAIRSELTFYELFEQYMNRYSKVHKKSWKYDEREVNKYLRHWFTRKISSIENHEVRKLHEKIYNQNGLYQANRILERLRAIFNKAIEWGWDGNNPTNGIKKYKEKSRDRFIKHNEIKYFFKALEAEENKTAKDFFKMLLFTGARKTNTLMMRWDEINFDFRAWKIPETKNGEPIIIPLIPEAIQLLEERKKLNPHNCPWVFKGSGKEGYYNDPKKAWIRTLERATVMLWKDIEELSGIIDLAKNNLPEFYTEKMLFKQIHKEAEIKSIELPIGLMDLRIHDLRRTLGSYQAINGSSTLIIGKSLGHKSTQSTEIYSRLYQDPIRKSVEGAVSTMFKLGENNG